MLPEAVAVLANMLECAVVAGGVGAAAVYDQDFDARHIEGLFEQRIETLPDKSLLIQHRHDDRNDDRIRFAQRLLPAVIIAIGII